MRDALQGTPRSARDSRNSPYVRPMKAIQKKRAAALESVKRFASNKFRGVIEGTTGEIEIKAALGGGRSLVYLAYQQGRPVAVIHAFDRKKDHAQLHAALTLGQGQELPIPKRLYASGLGLDRARFGHWFVASEFIVGEDLAGKRPEQLPISALATTVRNLHRVEQSRWGKPGKFKSSPILEDWRRSAFERLDSLEKKLPASEPIVPELRGWFAQKLDSLEEPATFQLCHHHLAPDDILFDEATGKLTIIDCGSLQFSRASRDLAAVHQGFFAEADEPWLRFLDEYFAENIADRAQIESETEFFDAFYLLSKLKNQASDESRRKHWLDRVRQATALRFA